MGPRGGSEPPEPELLAERRGVAPRLRGCMAAGASPPLCEATWRLTLAPAWRRRGGGSVKFSVRRPPDAASVVDACVAVVPAWTSSDTERGINEGRWGWPRSGVAALCERMWPGGRVVVVLALSALPLPPPLRKGKEAASSRFSNSCASSRSTTLSAAEEPQLIDACLGGLGTLPSSVAVVASPRELADVSWLATKLGVGLSRIWDCDSSPLVERRLMATLSAVEAG